MDRTTASAIYHRDFGDDEVADHARLGPQKRRPWRFDRFVSAGVRDRARQTHTFFGRAERADKNELFLEGDPREHDTFTVGKLTGGYMYDFKTDGHFKLGVGGLVSVYSLPQELHPVYGSSPTSFMLFARGENPVAGCRSTGQRKAAATQSVLVSQPVENQKRPWSTHLANLARATF